MTNQKIIAFGLAGVLAASALPAHAQDVDRSDWPGSVVVATASPGGTYAIYGQGIATIISNHVGVSASTQQTQGPSQNVVLVHNKRVEVGMTTMGPAYEAWTGVGDLDPGTEYREIRALFPMFVTPFQGVALARSGITSVADLEGRTVGAGPRAGTGGTYWERWLNDLGMNVTVQHGPLGDQISQLADGRLDAVVTAAGLPTAAISELETTTDAVIFSLSQEQIDALLPDLPYAQAMEIPADTYSSMDESIPTLGMWNVAIAHADMPESLAYEIVKAIFDNHEDLVATHASAQETLLENYEVAGFMPYHPGAVRYFREQGIELEGDLLPPEMQD